MLIGRGNNPAFLFLIVIDFYLKAKIKPGIGRVMLSCSSHKNLLMIPIYAENLIPHRENV